MSSGPSAVAFSPDGSTAYVPSGNFGSTGLYLIDTAARVTTGSPISTGGLQRAVAVSPNGSTVYVTSGFTTCIEHGNNHVIDGETVNLKHRATNIFRKETDGWHLVHHHTDSSATD